MTDLWLTISRIFEWSYGFMNWGGYEVNWIFFITACLFFLYWVRTLIVSFGGDKDKKYHSSTEAHHPYYSEKIYKNPSKS